MYAKIMIGLRKIVFRESGILENLDPG